MQIEYENTENSDHLLSDQIKWMVIHYKTQGWSNKKVAREVGQSYNRPSLQPKTVKALWEKYQSTSSVQNNWSQEGRPTILEYEEIEEIKEYFENNPKKSVNEARIALRVPASRQTINRHILQLGVKAYRAPKKIYISERNVALRLQWALRNENKGLNYWRTVIFSDESSFSLVNPNGRLFLRRTLEADYENQIQFKAKSQSLMVWGSISYEGVGLLARIDEIEEGKTTLNGERYLTLLKRRLLQNYPLLKNQKLRFQHDNATAHTKLEVEDWLAEKGVITLEWPAQSPDMNIIECVWNELKYRLRGECFSSKNELWKRLKKEWRSITPTYIRELYESLSRRVSEIIRAEGKHTKY